MKKLLVILFAAGIALASCNGTDKTHRNSDTDAAKGSGGPADSTQTIRSSGAVGGSAVSPGSTDTSSISDTAASPVADTVNGRPVH